MLFWLSTESEFIGKYILFGFIACIVLLIAGGIADTVKNFKKGVSSQPLWGRILLIILGLLLFPIVLIGGIAYFATKGNHKH